MRQLCGLAHGPRLLRVWSLLRSIASWPSDSRLFVIVCGCDPNEALALVQEVTGAPCILTCDREAAASGLRVLPAQGAAARTARRHPPAAAGCPLPYRVSRAAGGAEVGAGNLCPGWVGAPAPGVGSLCHVPALESVEAVPSVLGVFWVLPAQAYCSTLGSLPLCGPAPTSEQVAVGTFLIPGAVGPWRGCLL